MKKRQFLSLVLTASLAFSSITWGQTIGETLTGSIASSSNASPNISLNASSSNAMYAAAAMPIELKATAQAFSSELKLTEGETAYAGGSLSLTITIKNLPENTALTLKYQKQNGTVHTSSTFTTSGTWTWRSSFPYGEYHFWLADQTDTAVSDKLTVQIKKYPKLYVTLNEAVFTKAYADPDPSISYISKDKISVIDPATNTSLSYYPLSNIEYEREAGEEPGSYKITKISSDECESIELQQNAFSSFTITERQTQDVELHTESEIQDYFETHPFDLSKKDTFSVTPDINAEIAGKLTDESVTNALNALNFIRYVAGIPSDLTINEEYEEYAQAGTTLLCKVHELQHTPSKPAGVSDAFYQKGYTGTSSSNLAYSSANDNLAYAVVRQWMNDGSSSNIDRVGHRRWCLNPHMEQTGFGHSNVYTAMYAFDNFSSDEYAYSYIPWPAQTMPVQYFNGPWSVSLSPDLYDAKNSHATVTLTSRRTGKVYTLDETCTDPSGKYFNLNLGNYGYGPCIIFEPRETFHAGDIVDVSISGLKYLSGADTSITYTVTFFDMEQTEQPQQKPLQSITLNASSVSLAANATYQLHATMNPADATDASLDQIVWTSSDASIASVDKTGKVTALSAGSAKITAALNGKSATCTITVSASGSEQPTQPTQPTQPQQKPLQEIRLNAASLSLYKDDSYTMKLIMVPADATDATLDQAVWTSSDESIASVDENGNITAVAVGSAVITAELNGKTATCTVRIRKKSSSGSSSGGGGSSSGGSGGSGGGGSSSSGKGSSSGGSSTNGPSGSSPNGTGGNNSSTNSSLPPYVVVGNWTDCSNGIWKFTDTTGSSYVNKWAAIYNPYANTAIGQSSFDWFRFDTNGNMMVGWFLDTDGNYYYMNPNSDGTRGKMVTGWMWIPDANGVQKCYYFNPISDGFRGKMLKDTTVEGYTLNADGQWVVNGVIQTK
ncbi:MAG: Ig-like domain-containing protein [bacterium]|nr:Ig-like domain-containing protein [bacterium]